MRNNISQNLHVTSEGAGVSHNNKNVLIFTCKKNKCVQWNAFWFCVSKNMLYKNTHSKFKIYTKKYIECFYIIKFVY